MRLTGRPTWKVAGILRRMAGSTSCGLLVAPITITCDYKNRQMQTEEQPDQGPILTINNQYVVTVNINWLG